MDVEDTARLAQQFLELWQREMSRQMSNPETLRAMLQAMQGFTVGQKENAHDAPRRAAAAPDAEHDAIRELTLRISALERELAKLKQRLRESVPAKKPARKKRRSAPTVMVETKRTTKRRPKRMGKRGVRRTKAKPKKR